MKRNKYKEFFAYYIEQVTIKEYIYVYSVNPLYIIFRYVNWYFEKINGNKYLTLVSTNESKEKIKKDMKNCGVKSDPPAMRRRSDVSVRSHIGWDVAHRAETSSRRRNRYVNETDLFETSLRRLIGTWKNWPIWDVITT